MTIALRESYTTLARRAFDNLPAIYMLLGLIGLISVAFAIAQESGVSPWPTLMDLPTGLFYSPIVQGGFLGLVIVALARIEWWEPMPILAVGIYLSENRGGWVIAGVGLLATWVRQPLVILAVILVGAFLFTFNPTLSDLERLNIWQAGWVNLTWFGHGWGSYSDVWIVKHNLGYQPIHAHNDYLELAFEFGLYAVPIFCVLAYALAQTQSPEWPLLVAYCTFATFAMPSYIPATAGIGALALASVLTKGVDNG